MINGVLVVDKPAGMTSHDIVNIVRRLARTRRVGHTGTLDPLATGLLILLVGPATRLARFISESAKTYRGVVRFGQTTTTYDAEGEVVASREVDLDLATIQALLPRFRGEIMQVPPAYAAVRVKGQRAYALARQGQKVDMEPRPVTIYALDIVAWEPPDLTLDVTCSSGTYIRSLAHDLGQAAGCGAHIAALRRTALGPFSLVEARTLDALEALRDEGRFAEALLPPSAALGAMPGVTLAADEEWAVRNGQAVSVEPPESQSLIQAHDGTGSLVAVMQQLEDGSYRPILVLPPATDA